MRDFHVNLSLFRFISPWRRVSLPALWTWQDVLAVPLFHQYDGARDVDLARWRGFLSLVDIIPVDSDPSLGPCRSMLSRCPLRYWLEEYLQFNLPQGFASVVSGPLASMNALWRSDVCLDVWHSVNSANLLNYADEVALEHGWFRENACMLVKGQWELEHAPLLVTEEMYAGWQELFTNQVNEQQPPAFRWLSEFLIDVRCCHRVWKATGGLPDWSLREVAYVAAWERREWGDFAN